MENCEQTAIVFSKPVCPQCDQAKNMLRSKNICIDERVLGKDATTEELFEKIGNPVRSVPQVFMVESGEDIYVGGVAELRETLNGNDQQG